MHFLPTIPSMCEKGANFNLKLPFKSILNLIINVNNFICSDNYIANAYYRDEKTPNKIEKSFYWEIGFWNLGIILYRGKAIFFSMKLMPLSLKNRYYYRQIYRRIRQSVWVRATYQHKIFFSLMHCSAVPDTWAPKV